jgi:hypothetical protein
MVSPFVNFEQAGEISDLTRETEGVNFFHGGKLEDLKFLMAQ